MKKKKKNNILLISIIILISLIVATILSINYYSKKTLPLIEDYAKSETQKLVIIIINKAITKEVYTINHDEIFDIKYNNKGEIIEIDLNSNKTTDILSKVTNSIEENLKSIEEGNIDNLDIPKNSLRDSNMDLLKKGVIMEIPLGISSSGVLLHNLGPKVPVRLSLIGDLITGFSTNIEEYGINNALLKLNIDIKVDAKVILPVISETITIKCSVPIAMKIIQGGIPNYYPSSYVKK